MLLAQKHEIHRYERIISTREVRLDLWIKSFSSAAWIIGLVIGSSGRITNSRTRYRFAFLAFRRQLSNFYPPALLNPLYIFSFSFSRHTSTLYTRDYSTTFEFHESIKGGFVAATFPCFSIPRL